MYANNQRPYPLVNPATGKPAPLHSEMALVCTTCAFDAPDPLGDKKYHHTINSTKKTDVRYAFFICPQCTAYTHAGLAAAKRYDNDATALAWRLTPSFHSGAQLSIRRPASLSI